MARSLVRIWKLKDNPPHRRWSAFIAPAEGTKHVGLFPTWESACAAASQAAREYLAAPEQFARRRAVPRIDDPSDGDDLIAMLAPLVVSHPARRLLAGVLVQMWRDLRSEDAMIRRSAREDMDAGRILWRYSVDDVANIFDVDGSELRSKLVGCGSGRGGGEAATADDPVRRGSGGRASDRSAAA